MCDSIEQGDTEKAIELAETIDDYNQYVSNERMIGIISILTQGGGVGARTPLLVACETGNVEMTAYDLAVDNNHDDVVEILQ